MAIPRYAIKQESIRTQIAKISKNLGVPQSVISKAVTGTPTSLSADISRGYMSVERMEKLSELYGINIDEVTYKDDPFKRGEQEPKETVAPPAEGESELLAAITKLTIAVDNVTLEIRALKQKNAEIGRDLYAELSDFHDMVKATPSPIAPADLKKVIEEGTNHDHTGDVMRGIKCAKDDIIDYIAFGVRKADRRRKDEEGRK